MAEARPWRCQAGWHILRTSTYSSSDLVMQQCLKCWYAYVVNVPWKQGVVEAQPSP